MKGIRLSHGVTFVEYDGVTVRIKADGKCEISPITLSSLEWDLRTEPPENWTYIGASDIDPDTLKEIERAVSDFYRVIGR